MSVCTTLMYRKCAEVSKVVFTKIGNSNSFLFPSCKIGMHEAKVSTLEKAINALKSSHEQEIFQF